MEINADFWNERYLNNQLGWDLKSPSTPLKEYIDQLNDKDIKILIPGCGNAYEAEYLIKKGFTNITLIDISEILVKNLQEKFKNDPQVKIINQDFFELEDKFDLILEQTFFCALNPNLRTKYAEKMHQLLYPEGKLVGLLFSIDFNNPFPPFGGSEIEYRELFQSKFLIKRLETAYNSIKPRSGTELFIQFSPRP
jgi:methyl halide transferase